MSSVAQFNANRANAQFSTGPKTESGQEACKYNATKTGIYSRQVVIKGEDPAEYERLHSKLYEQWKPENEMETMLVEQLAQNWWRLERARGIENEMYEKYGKVEAYENKAFLALQRQMTTTERAWQAALREIQKLRALAVIDKKENFRSAVLRSMMKSQAEAEEKAKIGSVPAKQQVNPVPAPAAPQSAGEIERKA